MRSVRRHADALRACHHRLHWHEVDGCALALERHDVAVVRGESDRHLACGYEVGEQDVTPTHVRL